MTDAVLSLISRYAEAPPGPGAIVFWTVAVAVPLVLLHELGHALAIRATVGGPVRIDVGLGGPGAYVRRGDLLIVVRPFTSSTTGGRACTPARRVSRRQMMVIALAGPGASLIGLVVCTALYLHVSTSGAVHDLLWIASAGSLEATVVNAIPMELTSGRDGRIHRTDGRLALDALRRRGAPPPVPIAPTANRERSVAPPGG